MRPSMIGRWRPHYWSRLFFLIALQSFITAPFFMGPLIGFFQWPLPYIFVLKKFWSEHSPIVYWLCAFLIFTFVHYWSHVARHRIPFLWRWCHQMHHGAERFEAYTSLYMHPFEVILLRLSLLPLLSFAGLDFKTLSVLGLWYSFFNAWVHMNLRTPRWLGYIIFRPEQHSHHHAGEECNFGVFPIWDLVFGTFRNPLSHPEQIGFRPEVDKSFWAHLLGRHVSDRTLSEKEESPLVDRREPAVFSSSLSRF